MSKDVALLGRLTTLTSVERIGDIPLVVTYEYVHLRQHVIGGNKVVCHSHPVWFHRMSASIGV